MRVGDAKRVFMGGWRRVLTMGVVLCAAALGGKRLGVWCSSPHASIPADSLRIYVSGDCAPSLTVTAGELERRDADVFLVPVDFRRPEMWRACFATLDRLGQRGRVWFPWLSRKELCYRLMDEGRKWLTQAQGRLLSFPAYARGDGVFRVGSEGVRGEVASGGGKGIVRQ